MNEDPYKGLKKGRCGFNREHGICTGRDPKTCKEMGGLDDEGWCLQIIIDTSSPEEWEEP